MTFARRKIDITFTLGSGTFTGTNSNTVKVSGLRCSALVTTGDSAATAELNLRINGLNLDIAKKLTILNQDYAQRLSKAVNFITIEAGDEGGSMATVFTGGIVEAWSDFSSMPDTSFVVQGTTALVNRYAPGTPTSFTQPTDAAIIMQTIAAKMDPPVRLENNGVEGKIISHPYYHGSMIEQMNDAARDMDINAIIDATTGNMVIWPRDGNRGGSIPLVSKDSGMIGYPTFNQYGVVVTTLYNPSIASGGMARVKSDILETEGDWYVYLVGHDLESETPNGRWFTHFEASVSKDARPTG